MKSVQKLILLLVALLYVHGNQYSPEDLGVYYRRDDHQEVTRKMVRYWSRPDVLPYLPRGMREYVRVYIQKYPQYKYPTPPVIPGYKWVGGYTPPEGEPARTILLKSLPPVPTHRREEEWKYLSPAPSPEKECAILKS
jgi:hypothetical protein